MSKLEFDITKNFFFSLCLIVFISLNLNSEKLDLIQIRLDKITEELNLNEEQRSKMLEILKEDDRELKSPLHMYNIASDSIDKILKIEKQKFNNELNEIKGFLTPDQYNQYVLILSSSIKDKFTIYISKELDLSPEKSLELNASLPFIIKKILIAKGKMSLDSTSNSKLTMKSEESPTEDLIKQINELMEVTVKEISDKLTEDQMKDFKEKGDEIRLYLHKDILGFENKPEDKKSHRGSDNFLDIGTGGSGR